MCGVFTCWPEAGPADIRGEPCRTESPPLPSRIAEQPREQSKVLECRQLLVDRRELRRHAQPASHDVGLTYDVVTEERRRTAVRSQQRRQHADRGRLARSIRTDEAVDSAPRHREIDPINRTGCTERLREADRLDCEVASAVEHNRHRTGQRVRTGACRRARVHQRAVSKTMVSDLRLPSSCCEAQLGTVQALRVGFGVESVEEPFDVRNVANGHDAGDAAVVDDCDSACIVLTNQGSDVRDGI